MAVIEPHGGLKVQAVNKGINKGERVVLAVRPKTFQIKKGNSGDETAMLGVVERMAFEGTNTGYEVRLENQDLVVTVTPSLACEWFNMGKKLF